MKRFGTLNAAQKTAALYIAPFLKNGQNLPGVKKSSKLNFKKKKLNQGEKCNKKIGGRSCLITSGASGDTLMYIVCHQSLGHDPNFFKTQNKVDHGVPYFTYAGR